MGYSVFPAPASGITQADLITVPNWTFLGRSTSSSASYTFSSISGYRMLQIRMFGVSQASTGNYVSLLFNGETAGNNKNVAGNYLRARSGSSPEVFRINQRDTLNIMGTLEGGFNLQFVSTINNADSTYLKMVETKGYGLSNTFAQDAQYESLGAYFGTSPISSIKVHYNSTGTTDAGSFSMMTGGAIELWGAK